MKSASNIANYTLEGRVVVAARIAEITTYRSHGLCKIRPRVKEIQKMAKACTEREVVKFLFKVASIIVAGRA